MKKSDRVQKRRELDKAQVIDFVKNWVKRRIEEYEEPTRLGTPKGDPIGLSQKKYYAAIVMILHSKALKLKEIAKISGVSDSVLRVWRTQKIFQEAAFEASESLGKDIAKYTEIIMAKWDIDELKNSKTIASTKDGILKILKSKKHLIEDIKEKNDIKRIIVLDDITDYQETIKSNDDPESVIFQIINFLLFLDLPVTLQFYRSVHQNINIATYPMLLLALKKSRNVFDEKDLRQWSINYKDITKKCISFGFDYITDPQSWEDYGAEYIQKFSQILKDMIFDEIDILAG